MAVPLRADDDRFRSDGRPRAPRRLVQVVRIGESPPCTRTRFCGSKPARLPAPPGGRKSRQEIGSASPALRLGERGALSTPARHPAARSTQGAVRELGPHGWASMPPAAPGALRRSGAPGGAEQRVGRLAATPERRPCVRLLRAPGARRGARDAPPSVALARPTPPPSRP